MISSTHLLILPLVKRQRSDSEEGSSASCLDNVIACCGDCFDNDNDFGTINASASISRSTEGGERARADKKGRAAQMKKLEDEILALQLAQEERATQMKIFDEENVRSNNMSEEEESARHS